jgi:hypothetical protein
MKYWNKYGYFLDYIGLKIWDIFLNWFWFGLSWKLGKLKFDCEE